MRRFAFVLGLGLLVLPTAAHADEDEDDQRALAATAAGAATSLASISLGSYYISRSRTKTGRNTWLVGMEGGLCLTPIVAHAFTGELARGAFFSLVPLAALGATVTLMAYDPDFVTKSPPMVQWGTYTALTVAIFGAALGTLDAARVDERRRAREKKSSVSFVPILGRDLNGAVLTGSL